MANFFLSPHAFGHEDIRPHSFSYEDTPPHVFRHEDIPTKILPRMLSDTKIFPHMLSAMKILELRITRPNTNYNIWICTFLAKYESVTSMPKYMSNK